MKKIKTKKSILMLTTGSSSFKDMSNTLKAYGI